MIAIRTLTAVAVAVTALVSSPARADDAMTVNKGSVTPGDGQSVTFKGSPLPLSGNPIKVGQPLPASTLTGGNLKPVNIAESGGKVRIINVVPSLDTPVCDAQTHELVEKDPALADNVELITVSMDLPFAQSRWARAAKVKNMQFLSDYKSGEFGTSTGLLIVPLHLLARSVIVTDKNGIVRYYQVVPEITELPDMQAAMDAAKGLM
jgi:thioredoxin-dependent peroxiredoxin